MPAIAINLVEPNPDQPRKHFDPDTLRELAASIASQGQLQPIVVRPHPLREGHFMILVGERRWRAHLLLGRPTIEAIVRDVDNQTMDVQAIVENLQRSNVSPMEETRAYQRMLDLYGMTVEELAAKIGVPSWKIEKRLELLNLRPEYQQLAASGQLNVTEATRMSRLAPPNQDKLFSMIQDGACPHWRDLHAVADSMAQAERQVAMFELPEPPSREELEMVSKLERRIDQLVRMLDAGFDSGEVVAARKVDPNKAVIYAEKLRLIIRHCDMMEKSLRGGAAAQSLFAA
jgi:ParB family transcriptional regulator, chromosome partitioning protein